MQGIVKDFKSGDGSGLILTDTEVEFAFTESSYAESIFSWFRVGQRVVFETLDDNTVVNMRTGGEIDMSLINAKV
jgi:cold shock CspA family protein